VVTGRGMRRTCVAAAVLLVLVSGPTPGVDLSFGLGEGNRVRSAGLGASLALLDGLPCPQPCTASLEANVRVARWWLPYEDLPGNALWDTAVSPVLRISAPSASGGTLFLAVGFGLHYLSRDSLGGVRRFGTHLQFGEFLEAGFAAESLRGDVLFRLEHVSNGATATPNNGVTFLGVEYRTSLGRR
jgi:hypothetical protein